MVPVVTVVMPVYNAERYVGAALESILAQTFPEFECIVVNDGSTDNSQAVLERYAARDERIKIISRPNTGIVGALNEALAVARGQFLARMDSDDICLPYRFERQVNFLRGNPRAVLVGANVMTMDADGAMIGVMVDVALTHEKIDGALLSRGWPIVHPVVMMRTENVRAIGGYHDLCPHEDHDLFLRLAEAGGTLHNLPDVLLYYRKHDSSISASQKKDNTRHLTKVIQDACARRGIEPPAILAAPIDDAGPSQAQTHRRYAWQAIKFKNISTARKYAWSALRKEPLCLESWRLTFCAVRGR